MDNMLSLPVHNTLGESPLWVPEENALYWVDHGAASIWRWQEARDQPESFQVPVPVSALARRRGGGLLVAAGLELAYWQPGGGLQTVARIPPPYPPDVRLNDGKVDAAGRFWVGEIDRTSKDGRLFRLDPDLSLHEMDRGFIVSNGIGWSPDHCTMYFADSRRYVIFAYDYDLEHGSIANRRVFAAFAEGNIVPDGLTVDSEGCIWCVHCRGGMLERFDPQGRSIHKVQLPTSGVTSCMFGGAALDRIFVTSSISLVSDEQRAAQPEAGNLFILDVGVRGLLEPVFKM